MASLALRCAILALLTVSLVHPASETVLAFSDDRSVFGAPFTLGLNVTFIELAPKRPTEGDIVTVTAYIHNRNATTSFVVDINMSVDATLLWSGKEVAIASGQNHSVTGQWTAVAGYHRVTVEVKMQPPFPPSAPPTLIAFGAATIAVKTKSNEAIWKPLVAIGVVVLVVSCVAAAPSIWCAMRKSRTPGPRKRAS